VKYAIFVKVDNETPYKFLLFETFFNAAITDVQFGAVVGSAVKWMGSRLRVWELRIEVSGPKAEVFVPFAPFKCLKLCSHSFKFIFYSPRYYSTGC
jgi:hypothetical protein